MEKNYSPISAIFSSLLMVALGFILVLFPFAAVKVAVIAFGIYTIVEGSYALIISFRLKEVARLFFINLVKALINLFVGILVVYFASTSEGSYVADWVSYIIAINLLLSAFTEFLELFLIKKAGFPSYGLSSGAVLSIIFAILMFLFPSFVSSIVPTLIGVGLIVAGVFSILWAVRMYFFVKNLKKEEKVVEAEWSEK